MEKHTSKITSKSIEQSGLPTDYKKALSEYIWNGFDAGATTLALDFTANELGRLDIFTISDNGTGIDVSSIDESFGSFLDSNKRDPFKKESFQKGRKGKGRYAFSTFANKCTWLTTFIEPNGKLLSYNIFINKEDLQNFIIEDRKVAKTTKTGTVVSFYDFFDLSEKSLISKEFIDFLASEFGWFLFLNRDKEYKILINGIELAYKDTIGDIEETEHQSGNDIFKIVYIRWNQKIGDKYFFYFLGQNHKEVAKKHTSFNNKAIEFHHSVYIESPFFDNFQETIDDNPVFDLFGNNQSHPSFKHLLKVLNLMISDKEKDYIRDIQAERLIQDYHIKAIFPEAKIKYDELENVVKEIYCVEPRIFLMSNIQQSKMLIGLLNLVLAAGNGENVIDVIESVVELNEHEREALIQVF